MHVPNQPSTNGQLSGKKLFGKEQFEMMKGSAIYISTCRGPVTDEQDLIDALKSGSIYGAGLDVLDPDPALPGQTVPGVRCSARRIRLQLTVAVVLPFTISTWRWWREV